MKVAPYGSWESPLTSSMVAAQAARLMELFCDEDKVYWSETRPKEKGRVALLKAHQTTHEELLPSFSVRTRVHEYGGGAFIVSKGDLFFSNGNDDGIYRWKPGSKEPSCLVKQPGCRYADFALSTDSKKLFCICEQQSTHILVCIDLETHACHSIAESQDFYAAPRVSRDGRFLAYLSWNAPGMPWDGTQLWRAEIDEEGLLKNSVLIAGGSEESICQPEWGEDGHLYFVSDKSGFWNLQRNCLGNTEALYSVEADCASPAWVFRNTHFALATIEGKTAIVCNHCSKAIDSLGILWVEEKRFEPLNLPYTSISHVSCYQGSCVFFGAGAAQLPALIHLNVKTKITTVIKESASFPLENTWISLPKHLPYGFYYPPKNPHYTAQEKEKPPLLVRCHGGPTAHASASLQLETQYWTSRGFAVVDVNYSGSSGYGRAFRKKLYGKWGILDVEDCAFAARDLVAQGLADEKRLLIKGKSAGGYTALRSQNIFVAITSYYGITDLEKLAQDTHSFEAHYLDLLIAPYPEHKEEYRARSPIYHLELFSRPLLLLQGKEDKVVSPHQAEMLFNALKERGVDVSLLLFEKESHGFKMEETIRQCLDAETIFYSRVIKQ